MSCLVSSMEALVGKFMASAKSRSCAPLSLDELRESVSPSGMESSVATVVLSTPVPSTFVELSMLRQVKGRLGGTSIINYLLAVYFLVLSLFQ